MEEIALLLSIISIILTAIFGVWNIRISVENHKMRKDEFLRSKLKEEKETFTRRPKLEIIEYYKENSMGYLDEEVDIDCLVVPISGYNKSLSRHTFDYPKDIKNNQEWVSITIKFKCVGLSPIDHLYFAWNAPRSTSLFDVKNNNYHYFIQNQLLNYRVILDKEIKTNDTFSIKINFHKDYISGKMSSAEAGIWMFDEFNNIWEQPLFVHAKKLYDSSLKTYKEFQNATHINDALACFENPYLW